MTDVIYHGKHYQAAIHEKNGRVWAPIRLNDSCGLQLRFSDADVQAFNDWKQSRLTEEKKPEQDTTMLW